MNNSEVHPEKRFDRAAFASWQNRAQREISVAETGAPVFKALLQGVDKDLSHLLPITNLMEHTQSSANQASVKTAHDQAPADLEVLCYADEIQALIDETKAQTVAAHSVIQADEALLMAS